MAEASRACRPFLPSTGYLLGKTGKRYSRRRQRKGFQRVVRARFLRKVMAARAKKRARNPQSAARSNPTAARSAPRSMTARRRPRHRLRGMKLLRGCEPVGRAGKVEQPAQQNLRHNEEQNELDDLERCSGQSRHQKAERHRHHGHRDAREHDEPQIALVGNPMNVSATHRMMADCTQARIPRQACSRRESALRSPAWRESAS